MKKTCGNCAYYESCRVLLNGELDEDESFPEVNGCGNFIDDRGNATKRNKIRKKN